MSGDSIPTAKPSDFLSPLFKASCVGYTDSDGSLPEFYVADRCFGTQWKYMMRQDVNVVVLESRRKGMHGEYQQECRAVERLLDADGQRACHRAGAADEWIIPTILNRSGSRATDFKQYEGTTIMEAHFTNDPARPCPKCKATDPGHAIMYSPCNHKALSDMLNTCFSDPYTFALRKIDSSFCRNRLLKLISPILEMP